MPHFLKNRVSLFNRLSLIYFEQGAVGLREGRDILIVSI